jgi:hypothetical protein
MTTKMIAADGREKRMFVADAELKSGGLVAGSAPRRGTFSALRANLCKSPLLLGRKPMRKNGSTLIDRDRL